MVSDSICQPAVVYYKHTYIIAIACHARRRGWLCSSTNVCSGLHIFDNAQDQLLDLHGCPGWILIADSCSPIVVFQYILIGSSPADIHAQWLLGATARSALSLHATACGLCVLVKLDYWPSFPHPFTRDHYFDNGWVSPAASSPTELRCRV